MKKTLVALAALAVTGAFAQSTVTLYGAVDAGVVFSSSEGNSRTSMGNSQYGSAKIGFTGVEDLGGGLKANFKLEGGLANDSGNGKASNTNNQRSGSGVTAGVATNNGGQQGLVFQRFAYVGLSGGFGELRLGRDYTSTFITSIGADPFGTNGPADATLLFLNLGGGRGQATAISASNMVGYETPKMGGFSARGQVFFGENSSAAANANDGDGYSLAATYANGPIFVSLGQQVTKGTAAAAVAGASLQTFGDYTQQALTATYDLGVAKLAYTYVKEQSVTNAAATASNTTNHVGVTVPMGAMNIKASYGRAVQNTGVAGAGDTAGVLVGLGADYALSKRTKAYVTYANVTNEGGGNSYSAGSAGGLSAKANASSQSLGLGIFHAF